MSNNQNDKAKVISFLNMKGGVSKTTLCKELGLFLSLIKGKKVLFVDIDPQANLTQSLFRKYGYKQDSEIVESDKSLKNTIASIEKMIMNKDIKALDKEEVIIDLESNISLIPGALGIDFTSRNLNSSELEGSLYNFIDANKLRDIYDLIFIDCPPTYSSYTTLALKASDAYLIPVRPEAYSILGIQMLLKVVKYILSAHEIYFKSNSLENLGIVFTNIKKTPTVGTNDLIEQIKNSKVVQSWNVGIFETYFEYNYQIPKDISYDIASSKSTISMQNMDILSEEFLDKLEGVNNDKSQS